MRFKNIKLSVVIPCYNHGKFLQEAIRSVLDSSFDAYEIIVVNDGSTDAFTLKVFKTLKQEYSKYSNVRMIHQDHLGVSAARNHGIGLSQGKYVLPLDADDRIHPEYLAKAVKILDQHAQVGVVYPHAYLFGQRQGFWEFPPFEPKRLLLHNSVVVSSVFRKEIWNACGGFDPELSIGYEDWDFWISAMEMGWEFCLLEGRMFDYRIKNGSRNSACEIPENRRALVRYICNKHKASYVRHFDFVISEKDVDLLRAIKQIQAFETAIQCPNSKRLDIHLKTSKFAKLIELLSFEAKLPREHRNFPTRIKMILKNFKRVILSEG